MSGLCLAIEMSTRVCSVAIDTGEDHPGDWPQRQFGGDQGSNVILEIEQLLTEKKLAREDLDLVVAGTGPGSYTGLRIACTAATSLALGLGIQEGGVDTFTATAASLLDDEESLHVVLDAYRKEAYWASYRKREGKVQCLQSPCVLPRAELIERIPAHQPVIGDTHLWPHSGPIAGSAWQPTARHLLQHLRTLDPAALPSPRPTYLRAAAFKAG